MKRPLAYITAAWCGDPDTDMELAARYCRMAYEAGFSPICPILYLHCSSTTLSRRNTKTGLICAGICCAALMYLWSAVTRWTRM